MRQFHRLTIGLNNRPYIKLKRKERANSSPLFLHEFCNRIYLTNSGLTNDLGGCSHSSARSKALVAQFLEGRF
jgi:hypothetical protein